VNNEDGSDKIRQTTEKAVERRLASAFDRLIVFFLVPPKRPFFPEIGPFDRPPSVMGLHGARLESVTH